MVDLSQTEMLDACQSIITSYCTFEICPMVSFENVSVHLRELCLRCKQISFIRPLENTHADWFKTVFL